MNCNILQKFKKPLYSTNNITNNNKISKNNLKDYQKNVKSKNNSYIKKINVYNKKNLVISERNNYIKKNNIKNNIIKNNIGLNQEYKNDIYFSTNNNEIKERKPIQNDEIISQYYLNPNFKKTRNKYNFQNKNVINSFQKKVNRTFLNDNNFYNNMNKILGEKKNNSFEKKIINNKLNINCSRLTNNSITEEDHIISIEYTNESIFNTQRNNDENFLNEKFNTKNINCLSYENLNNYHIIQKPKKKNKIKINLINYQSYISDDMNKNNDTNNNNNYIDNNLNNTDNYYYNIMNIKKTSFPKLAITQNSIKNETKLDNEFSNYLELTNEKTQKDRNSVKIIKVNKNNNSNISLINKNVKNDDNKSNLIKNISIPYNVSKKIKMNILNISDIRNDYIQSQTKKNNNISKKKVLNKKEEQSKLFKKNEYYKQIKQNSQKIKNKINSNSYNTNLNEQKFTNNYKNNLKNKKNDIIKNIDNKLDNKNNNNNNKIQKKNTNDIIEIHYFNKDNNRNSEKNMINHPKILLEKDRKNKSTNSNNSADLEKYKNSKFFQNNLKDRKLKISDFYNLNESENFFETKYKSSRHDNKKMNILFSKFSIGNLGNKYIFSNSNGTKSPNNSIKKNEKIDSKIIDFSNITHQSNNTIQYNQNNNANISYNVKNIDFDNYNYKNNLIYNSIDSHQSNLGKNKNKTKKYNIKNNLNKSIGYIKKDINIKNNNNEYYSLLNSINNNQLNNNPVKLYLRKKEIKYNRDNFIESINNNINDKFDKNNIYFEQINISNRNNNIINNNNFNLNVLNVKNNYIVKPKKSPKQNISYFSTFEVKENRKLPKSNENTIKNISNKLFIKNNDIKDFYQLKTSIDKDNKNNNNDYTIDPLYLKTSTFKFIDNNIDFNKTENNTQSSINILDKTIKSQKAIFTGKNRKSIILNNSEKILTNKNSPRIEQKNNKINLIKRKNNFKISRRRLINKGINNNLINDDINNKLFTNNDIIHTINSQKKESFHRNSINYNKKLNIPSISTNKSFQLQVSYQFKNKTPKNIYVKPYNIFNKPNSKHNAKSLSNIKINKNNFSSLKKSCKIPKIFNCEIEMNNTTSSFFLNDENMRTNINSLKKNNAYSLSLSTKNNKSSLFFQDNDYFYENKNNQTEKNLILNKIKKPFKKSYCYIYKLFNYFIRQPKIEKCYFSKNLKNHNFSHKLTRNNNIKTLGKELHITYSNNYNEEEKINESSQNGLLVTFGEISSNKRNIDKNNISDNCNNSKENMGNIIDSIVEYSDNEIYKGIYDFQKKNNNKVKVINESKVENKNEKKNKNKIIAKTPENNLQNAEKGLNILREIILRRGIKTKEEKLNNNNEYKNTKIKKGINTLNELLNCGKKNEQNIKDKENNDDSDKKSKSVDKNIAKGISKIENIFEKINLNKNKSNNDILYKKKYKKNNHIYPNIYNNIIDYYNEKTKLKTYETKSKIKLSLPNFNFKSNLYSENIKKSNLSLKDNLLSEEDINRFNQLNSNNNNENFKLNNLNNNTKNQNVQSLENKRIDKENILNIKNDKEEFRDYLNQIKNFQSKNNIKHDIIYLLNILVKNNYSDILKNITEIILYQNNNNSLNYLLNSNSDIIKNEHLFKTIIFNKAMNEKKNIFLYAQLCNDLNSNISNELREQKNMRNNKERNLKLIINDECIVVLNNFKKLEINQITDKENEEYINLKNKVIGLVNFIYELIKLEVLKQQFGLYTLEQLYKIYNNNNLNILIKNLFLEASIILLNKLGKLVLEKNNKKLIENINNYINKNLYNIINKENKNNNNIPNYLRLKIMKLLIKRDNQWKDHLFEILKEEEKEEKKNNKTNKNNKPNDKIKLDSTSNSINDSISSYSFNKKDINDTEKSIKDVNKEIIKDDLINYISYFTEENSKGDINIKNNIDKSYNWKVIEELINDKNIGLESIINYFISICKNLIFDENKLLIANDYIKNIIEYYSSNLSKKDIDSINNEMIKTFLNIDDKVSKNKNMYKILGNLLFILIDNKLYHIKYFNNYLKVKNQTQINLAIITRYCIISSGKFAKKYLNDFKQTKLFLNNDIFIKYVNEALKDLFYFIK